MKTYEPPEMYSERLVLESLRAQCCKKPNLASPYTIPEWLCPADCTCPVGGGPSL